MSYEGDAIQLLEGRDAVRVRPGMYIGGTDKAGVHHLIWEIVDNSVDEAINGYATQIEVTLHEDGSTITVKDDGRGIPITPEKKTGKPAVEVVFSNLHSGGKFGGDGSSYKSSGGLHGVGAAVTNFLSEFLSAKVFRDEKVYQLSFQQGILSQELEEVGTYSKYSQQGTGTEVTFKPDSEIFPSIQYDPKYIAERLEIKTYVNPGLRIVFKNLGSGEEIVYHHPDGIQDYLARILKTEKASPIHSPCIKLEGVNEDQDRIKYEIVFQWTEDTSETCASFVNAIPTPSGGTHEQGFKDGLARAIRSYMDTSSEVPKKLQIRAEDIREGLKSIVNVFTEGEIQFQSQNKVKLNNPEMVGPISSGVRVALETYLFENSATADLIVQRIVQAAKARAASRAIQKSSKRKKKNANKLTLPGKLSDCSSNTPEDCEIFLVEGDSAGGTGKAARDRATQAILPLRGKVLNAESATEKKVLANKELSGIVEALGCGIGDKFDLDDLRYHKIILLMDADSDGHHITTLLLTFFYRWLPELIENGHVYLAQPPLYKITQGKDRHWAHSDKQKEEILAKLPKNRSFEVSRFKGLGEMMADALKETTLDRNTRNLIQVQISGGMEDETDELISDLMGKKVENRQEMILKNLSNPDNLDI